jgi:hypothetical protein
MVGEPLGAECPREDEPGGDEEPDEESRPSRVRRAGNTITRAVVRRTPRAAGITRNGTSVKTVPT